MYFNKSHIYLDSIGVASIQDVKSNIIIKGRDFATAKRNNQIEYRDDGVYLQIEGGQWIRGYYYMKDYDMIQYKKTPKFHLFNCETMQRKNLFLGKYVWSNDKYVNVVERSTKETKKDLILELCSNCRDNLLENIIDTKDFYNSNSHEEIIKPEKELDMFKYPINWKDIATQFKEKNGLICSNCKCSSDGESRDKWFFDVHHINGNKSDCNNSNLMVLCKLCHIYENDYHLENAKKFPNRNTSLHEFVRVHNQKLLNNSYLKRYIKDFSDFLNKY